MLDKPKKGVGLALCSLCICTGDLRLAKTWLPFDAYPKEHWKRWIHSKDYIAKKRYHPYVGWGRPCGCLSCLSQHRIHVELKKYAYADKYLV